MSQPFLGQVIPVAFNFVPLGWLPCDGSLQPISEYTALFQLLGTNFGGDGQTTFGLPDLRGRLALGFGKAPALQDYQLGQVGGVEQVTLTPAQIAAHSHALMAAIDATSQSPAASTVLGTTPSGQQMAYVAGGGNTTLAPASVSPVTGGGTPHDNRQPYLAVTYIIAAAGIFPSQN